MAASIKQLLYDLAPAYPNLQYLVIVGDDRLIPFRRIRDEALYANERHYAPTAYTPILSSSLGLRFFLSDDYYAGLLPLPFKGRELYLPQVALGRLVEKPSEIARAIDAYLARPVVAPQDALVTGYDFLIDEATAIRTALQAQGVTTLTTLINNTWTASVFSSTFFSRATAFNISSLNSHFEHYRFFPNDPNDIFATQVAASTNYSGSLIFTVGCHSGLNVPDEGMPSQLLGTDWAQAFSRQRATYIANTGYGYGDSDLIAYSERLMANFAQELGYWGKGPQTVGKALLNAKHRYYNSLPVQTFSNYDEKVLGITTLYGLPMLRVNMPVTTTARPGGLLEPLEGTAPTATELTTETLTLRFTYVPSNTNSGTFFQVANVDDLQISAGRPVQPRTSKDIHQPDTIAHGVLMLGGVFQAFPDFDPVISQIVTDRTPLNNEPLYDTTEWYPTVPGSINRFLSIDGQSRERLVVVPAQYRAHGPGSSIGTERRYNSLDFAVYRAPFTATDFIAPNIWQVDAFSTTVNVVFRVRVSDDSGSIHRVVMLYRRTNANTWSRVDLAHDPTIGLGHWQRGYGSCADRVLRASSRSDRQCRTGARSRQRIYPGAPRRGYLPAAHS